MANQPMARLFTRAKRSANGMKLDDPTQQPVQNTAQPVGNEDGTHVLGAENVRSRFRPGLERIPIAMRPARDRTPVGSAAHERQELP